GADETDGLLEALYGDRKRSSQTGTPLRAALQRAGQYFHQDDGISLDGGTENDSPYAPPSEGGACQKAVAVVVTDGDWNGPAPDEGNADGNDGKPYADQHKGTLADMAMVYYENDLSSALDQKVSADSWDEAAHQHMTTYTLSLGGPGRIGPFALNGNGVDDMDEPGTWRYSEDPGFQDPDAPAPSWPDPSLGRPEKIDDLFHAAVNGRGLFLSGSDPRQLNRRLSALVENIAPKKGSAASAVLSGETMSEGARFYEATFDSDDWSGELTAFPLDPETGGLVPPGDGERFKAMGGWEASEQLKAESRDRRIVTYDGVSGGIPFRWSALTDFQKTALCPGWETDTEDLALGEKIVSHLRGGTVDGFRKRTGTLGDFVHSAPVFVSGGPGGEGTVYAGGNDGMLHAFNAETGEERFAYVPGLLFHMTSDRFEMTDPVSRLRELTMPDYTHRFYVDLTPTAAQVYTGRDISAWDFSDPEDDAPTEGLRTVLIGGLGKGGRGYYALDVTTADSVSDEQGAAELVLWEYPGAEAYEGAAAADDDLGLSFSRALIVKSNWLKSDEAEAEYQWVVIFGNGYESPGGQALLFVLDLEGRLVRKIRTDPAQSPGNGLSTPSVVDVNNDNRADYVYAGDMLGNLWKFDLTADDPAGWDTAFYDGGVPMPLFKASFAESGGKTRPQPITTQPDVMYHCSGQGYMVVFGTGRFLGDADLNDTGVQTVYGIWDYGDDTDDREYPGALVNRGTGALSGPGGLRLLRQEEIDWRATGGDRLAGNGSGSLPEDPE
ncbi:MAG: PQQ-binding-like beta-propeller repeat protein, partial [Deltaproteobacteria bacterium]|nr:PQQ-binding-like beta-propeller repeat protein [Deltaproteobacteria bacterium]